MGYSDEVLTGKYYVMSRKGPVSAALRILGIGIWFLLGLGNRIVPHPLSGSLLFALNHRCKESNDIHFISACFFLQALLANCADCVTAVCCFL